MSDQENTETQQNPGALAEEEEHEETEPETDEGEEGESPDEQDEDSEGEQTGAAVAAPVAQPKGASTVSSSAQAVAWKEDPLDFDESTVEIAVTLHPLRGRPAAERIVTICIHNHSGSPLYDSARQSELTEESALDRLQGWIAKNVKKFRAELSRRKQQQWEAEQQRKQNRARSRSAATASSAAVGTTVPATLPSTATPKQEGGALSPSNTTSGPGQAQVPATSSHDKTAKGAAQKQGEPELVQNSLF